MERHLHWSLSVKGEQGCPHPFTLRKWQWSSLREPQGNGPQERTVEPRRVPPFPVESLGFVIIKADGNFFTAVAPTVQRHFEGTC